MIYKTYRIGDICSTVKGTYPTMKTEPGQYSLVVTAEYRRSAGTYQLEGPAVCVPLISSTGHGDAALHRVHYQEGKFALANLLVALIPNDINICDAKYLYHLFMAKKDEYFVPLMSGTANVSLKIQDIANVEIPLPPVEEQGRIVARIEELAARIEEARGLRREAVEEASHILESAMRGIYDFKGTKRTVGDFASVLGGFAFPSEQYTDNGSHQIVRIGNIRDGYLDLSRAPIGWDLNNDSRITKYRLMEGDILISMTGTRNKRDYGYIAIVPQGQNLLLNQRVGKFIFHAAINRYYFAYFLRSPFFRDHLFPNATGTANQANIGNKHIENVPFDPPSSIAEQQCIVAYLDTLQSKIDSLLKLQSETSAELDALLPSILDKAFKGEL